MIETRHDSTRRLNQSSTTAKKVLTGRGEWVTPILFGVLDDRSRLLQADLGARPNDADGAHEAAAGRRLLRTEQMLDAGADAALRAVRRRPGLGQRMTPRRADINMLHAGGVSPRWSTSFSSRVLRGFGAGTMLPSTICPPRAM